ncbi:DUF4249 domain-containing protein [Chitinophaga rhizophila]|uniref:DUF4249 domain-containing protein n=1 Tax=Chitinophaga rhizophila TaxID=2866212 RepID=A0ABS7GBF0_9BACT|nr:DUF4249 domain-containing protein [Chitinophaga rhizophila]MBW8685001.1 DUF4249 domain-containing protein [Chitinophaga rhizophila]
MRNSFIYTILGGALLLGTACEKEIDLNLNGNDNKYVIEGVLTDNKGGCSVKISRTKNFDGDNEFNGVAGASVKIWSGTDTTLLSETTAGVYTAPELSGVSGTTYGLLVTIDGEQITAMSRMPTKVPFTNLDVLDEDLFGDLTKIATVSFKDPAGEANYYRFRQYLNGRAIKSYWVRNDDLTNGNDITARLYIFGDANDDDENELKSGDEVTVDMMNIDADVYKYFYSLSNSATGESNSATPANPVSNIKGNAIGYFSAQTIETKTVIVP